MLLYTVLFIEKSDGQSNSSAGRQGSKLAANLTGPNDISLAKDDQPVQPRKIKFPCHVIGRLYRSFNLSIYDKYLWLEYSKCEDAVFWFYCRHFFAVRKEPAFITHSMRNSKKCHGTKSNNNKLLEHQTSFQHAESVAATLTIWI